MQISGNKQSFVLLLIAAIMGGGITFGLLSLVGWDNTRTITYTTTQSLPVQKARMGDKLSTRPLDFSTTAEQVMPAVVHIRSTQTITSTREGYYDQQIPDPFREFFDNFRNFDAPNAQPRNRPKLRQGTGSGVIIDPEGYIITNNHVIDQADELEVTLHDNRSFKAELIGTDPTTDIALIKIKEDHLPFLTFSNSDQAKVGEWVLAVGNPFNLNSTVTAGIISAKGRNINILRKEYAIESFIQTDAAINRGNSGGALVNLDGDLIGINTALASPTGSYSGYGFAVPANIASKVIEDLRNYGAVQRGVLGISIRTIDANFAKEQNLNVKDGVWVDSLMANSAAREAGIKVGDVIIEADGKSTPNSPRLQEIIGGKRPGDKVKIMVNRNGKEKSYDVILNNTAGTTAKIAFSEANLEDRLGIYLEELAKGEASELNIKGGVKVSSIKSGIISKHTNLRQGFIITKVDERPISSKKELMNILSSKEGGVMLEGIYQDIPGTYYYAFGL